MPLKHELKPPRVTSKKRLHSQLDTDLWKGDRMRRIVRSDLLRIAEAFIDYVGVLDDAVDDIVMTGSMANYNYTEASDIDLHIIIDLPMIDSNEEVAKQLLDAKRRAWAAVHDIEIYGHPVELYGQDATEPHSSTGVYSVQRDRWIVHPHHFKGKIDHAAAKRKAQDLADRIEDAVSRQDIDDLERIKDRIKRMRQAGLHREGEFSTENLAFKALRNAGHIGLLLDTIGDIRDKELSLPRDTD